MSKRFKLFLAIILGVVAIACCVAGCSVGEPGRDEILANYNGGQVTYYANGGSFNNNKAIVVRELHFKEADVPFFDITDDEKSVTYVLSGGYDFTGWYLPARHESGEHAGEIMYTYTDSSGKEAYAYPKLNEDGTPVTDSTEARPVFYIDGSEADILEKNIRIVPSDTLVDSSYTVKADEHLIVCATWKPALRFVYKLAVDKSFVYNGKTYSQGTEITSMPFGKGETASPGQTTTVNFDGMTFVSNYTDETRTTYASTYNRADYEEGQTEIVVWSKFIEGSWTVIKNNANDIKNMFSGLNSSSKAYYLLEDVDCSSVSNFGVVQGVRAKVEGNGHTLSNLKFSAASLANNASIAPVFGAIYATAQITNLKLSNITISVTGKGNLTIYAVCKSIEDGATLENLTIENITATVDIPSANRVDNAQNDSRTSWIFGGKGTDSDFLTAYSGVKLTGDNTLTIK